jgi:hypothetical protein
MPKYLTVAHQTATSPELLEKARELMAEHPGTRFTILVPADAHLVTDDGDDAEAAARRVVAEARGRFEGAGLRVEDALIGDPSPVKAIEEEMMRSPGAYDAIILCTLPQGVSKWLGMDVHKRVERKFDLPVMHVVAQPAMAGAR